MKTLALSAVAATIALGSLAAPAFAQSTSDALNLDFNSTVVSADAAAGTIKLSSGQTLDQSLEYFAFPRNIAAGDKVRVDIDGNDHTLKGVRVIRFEFPYMADARAAGRRRAGRGKPRRRRPRIRDR